MLKKGYKFVPVGGNPSNAGPIEMASEPISPLIERLMNAFDGVIELYAAIKGSGQTLPISPREAVTRWCDIKGGHAYNLTIQERQEIAEQIQVIIDDSGEGKDKAPTFIFRDFGIGIHPDDWSHTILSLNKSNKLDKPYLAGAYGQGGSSTYAFCQYSLILSRRNSKCLDQRKDCVGWSVVRINDTDESLKNAVYEYLVDPYGNIPVSDQICDFGAGTYIAHIAYRSGNVGKAMTLEGYRVFNNNLFDPILPYWFRDPRYKQNRAMAGHISRVLPQENEMVEYSGSYTKILAPESKIVIRYWVFNIKKKSQNEKDKESFLSGFLETPKSPNTILITLNGQKQGFLSKSFIKQEIEMPFLANYILVQIECDNLDRKMKRGLFSSTREKAKTGEALDTIKEALREALTQDEQLKRIEMERKQLQNTKMDEEAQNRVRKLLDKYITKHLSSAKEVAATTETANTAIFPNTKLGQVPSDLGKTRGFPSHGLRPPHPPAPLPPPLPVNDPPTFLHIVSSDPLKIKAGDSSWLRVECDVADDFFTRPENPGSLSVLFTGINAKKEAETGLRGGRFRIKISMPNNAEVGTMGNVLVKIEGSGFEPLIATCAIVVDNEEKTKPENEARPTPAPVPVAPPYKIETVSREDEMWDVLDWDGTSVGEFKNSQGELIFYISISNNNYLKEKLRKKTEELAAAFTAKYAAMIAFNLWLHFQNEQEGKVLEDEALQEELKRTAQTVILSMRSEAELDQDDDE